MWKYLIPLVMLSAPVFSADITRLEYLEAHTESDRLRALSESERHLMYQKIVAAEGFNCSKVTHSFIRGTDNSDKTVFVTVRCENGVDYIVIHGGNNTPGHKSVSTCHRLYVLGLQNYPSGCWEPL